MLINKKTLSSISKQNSKETGWIYIGDDKERYVLGQPGIYNVMVIGVNPSTATPEKDDTTVRNVRKIVDNNGYYGWIMINIYPLIATNTEDLPLNADKSLIKQNIKVINHVINNYNIGAFWAAWGDLIDTRDYLGNALVEMFNSIQSEREWYCIGNMTRKGNPRHPLYLKTDSKFEPFCMGDYICFWEY
ncbi:MAG: DUF1643 domain-containing protein [Eubacterium sp.]|nr:DUF1643 domain-containing protein [Eubacterium sp.]